jgi:DNA mismatch repair protein MutS2
MVEIRRDAGQDTLVLLDEMAAGTDPREGAALAQAILEDLASRGALGIVTTHYHELKALASSDTRFRNAGMEFDAATLHPTYRLVLDLPGRSSALATARRLGLEESVTERAETLLGEEGARLDGLLEAVAETHRRRQEDQQRVAEARREAEETAMKVRGELERLREREVRFLDEERAQLAQDLERARREIGVLVQRLQKEKELSRAEEARRRLREIEKESAARIEKVRPEEPGRPLEDLREGEVVWLSGLRRTAKVVAPPEGGKVQVLVGSVRMPVPLTGLERTAPSGEPRGKERGASTQPAAAPQDHVPFTPQTSRNTCDLRGLRVDEALDRLDAFLDDSMQAHVSPLVVIHGHGTGALRDAVRKHLASSPYPAAFRPGKEGEGSDGVTIVRLP